MRHRWMTFLLLVVPLAVLAATPQSIRVQGSLMDRSSGTTVPAQGVFSMTFVLFDGQIGGLPIATVGPMAVDVVAKQGEGDDQRDQLPAVILQDAFQFTTIGGVPALAEESGQGLEDIEIAEDGGRNF